MDKNLIEKYGLAKEIAKMKLVESYNPKVGTNKPLNEYSFVTQTEPLLTDNIVDEDNEQNGQQTPPPNAPQGNQQPQDGGQQPPMQGGQDPMMAGMPQGGNPMGGNVDPSQGQDMGGGQQPAPGMDAGPVDGVGTDLEDMGTDVDGGISDSNEEVIDVDDLTNAQAETERKVDAVDGKLGSILQAVQTLQSVIDNNDRKIEDLKAEIERRNPTPEEKLDIRSQSSYPYNSTPKEYWDGKNADPNSNYVASYDNDLPSSTNSKFDILSQDLNNINLKKISDSLDNMPDLNDYFDTDF